MLGIKDKNAKLYHPAYVTSLNNCRFIEISYIFLFILFLLPLSQCSLHSTFKHFEKLKTNEIVSRVKRHTSGRHKVTIASFTAFQVRFKLVLTPGTHILHPKIKAKQVDGNGKETPFVVDRNLFFSGTVNNYSNQEVDAAKFGDTWIVHIHTPWEFYALEPMKYYDDRASDKDLIVYRGKDIRIGNTSMCRANSFTGKQSTQADHVTKHAPLKEKKPLRTGFKFVDSYNGATFHPANLAVKLLNQRRTKTSSLKEVVKRLETIYDNTVRGDILFKNHTKTLQYRHRRRKRRHIGEQSTQNTNTSARWRQPKEKLESPLSFPQLKENEIAPRTTECEMLLIADYSLFQGLGLESVSRTVGLMVTIFRLVDRIFRRTVFGTLQPGYGIMVAGVLVHTKKTHFKGKFPPYHSRPLGVNANTLIKDLMMEPGFTRYCNVHLMAQRKLGPELGLAVVAVCDSWKDGICSGKRTNIPGSFRSLNVGLSTVLGVHGRIVSMKKYSTIVAHEIGHNWGANHDPVKIYSRCNPSPEDGGSYIMAPEIAKQHSPNADVFSPCSRMDITRVLTMRAHKCFIQKQALRQLCGNGVLDPAEDCDPGFPHFASDPCCSKTCAFKPTAVCSPRSQPCCTQDCKIAPTTQTCRPRGGMYPCHTSSNCTGESPWDCPTPRALPNKTPCGDGGWCWHGRCMSFCERLGLLMTPPKDVVPCVCKENPQVMCRRCCRMEMSQQEGAPKICQVMGPKLKDLSTCPLGYCEDGTCIKAMTSDTITGPFDNIAAVFEKSSGSRQALTFCNQLAFALVALVPKFATML